MACIKSTPGDLASEGARSTDNQNLHLPTSEAG
jgi:hypothetical protein